MSGHDQQLRVSIEGFVYELKMDLPKLASEHPNGIQISHLHDYYGESPTRILRAITILQEQGRVTLHQAANKQHYILPTGYSPITHFPELTELQRRFVSLMEKTCLVNTTSPTTQIQTSYAQLARLLECSQGGIRTCIQRLEKLDYIEVVQEAAQGRQGSMILEMTPKLLDKIKTS